MIKKEITYTDFDGNQVTEEHYFHLSKSELIEMELAAEGGLAETLKAMIAAGDMRKILTTFKDVIAQGYGTRDASDARKFRKSKEATDEFLDSLAFDAMYLELMTSPTAAAEFVNGMVPTDVSSNPDVIRAMAEAVPSTEALAASAGAEDVKEPARAFLESDSGLEDPRDSAGGLLPWAFREPSQKELMSMSKTQLLQVMGRRSSGWKPPA